MNFQVGYNKKILTPKILEDSQQIEELNSLEIQEVEQKISSVQQTHNKDNFLNSQGQLLPNQKIKVSSSEKENVNRSDANNKIVLNEKSQTPINNHNNINQVNQKQQHNQQQKNQQKNNIQNKNQSQRHFVFNEVNGNSEQKFESNFIKTSKYTLLNFFPYCLIQQFKRYANVYFLIIAILQSIEQISPLTPFSAWTPLIFVLALSIIREGIEDRDRHISDLELNSSKSKVYRKNEFQLVDWKDIHVGDIVKTLEGETFPADLIVIKSSAEDGSCFIETSSLDGEKNLKPKQVLTETKDWAYETQVNVKGDCTCIPPDQDLYRFEGSLKEKQSGKSLSVGSKQFLLRGSKLKNTQYVIGIVAYTGNDTKIMQNADESKYKQSNIENITNKIILLILAFQIIVSLVSAIGAFVWYDQFLDGNYYLIGEDMEEPYAIAILSFFTYIVLNNTMIPISLIVSLEIVKFIQGYLIQSDYEMYSQIKGRGPKVFSTSINEELGQIEYIFSDKTGTLTCNIMEFKLLMVGGDLFGDLGVLGDNPIVKKTEAKKSQMVPKQQFFQKKKTHLIDTQSEIVVDHLDQALIYLLNINNKEDKFLHKQFQPFNLKNQNNDKVLYSIDNRQQLAQEILLLLSCCHECIVEQKTESSNQNEISKQSVYQNVIRQDIRYQGPSPDEVTLVDIARQFGYVFMKQTSDKISLELWKKFDQKQQNSDLDLDLYMLFPFDSDRKRMSVVIKHQGKYKLLIKGADNMILERLNKTEKLSHKDTIVEYISEFSKKGLRTLLLSMKVLEEEEFLEYKKKYDALADSTNREKDLALLGEEIETNLYLLGATAVEDKLQDQVPETIRDLLKANIKVWMLTGDKMETAENIARSCKLIQPEFAVLCFQPELDEKKIPKPGSIETELDIKIAEVQDLIKTKKQKKGFLIEGQYLGEILKSQTAQEKLIQVIQHCESVVCCRATPKQKAAVVALVKRKLNKITLAVGDGANDVNMIQEAHIGIGLYGQEGMRAVQASDFALPEFKMLWRLILVHGRWSYIRISEMILYFFYKNLIFTIPQFFFSFSCAYSGQTIFDDWYITLYNIIFTCLPLIIRAITEQDVYFKQEIEKKKNPQDLTESEQIHTKQTKNKVLKNFKDNSQLKDVYPQMYYIGQQNKIFNVKNFFSWMLQGFFHAGIIYAINLVALDQEPTSVDGYSQDMWLLSISIYTSIIFVVNIKLMIHTKFHTFCIWVTMIVTSFLAYFIYIVISSYVDAFSVYGTLETFIVSPTFYLSIFLCVMAVFAFDCVILYFSTFEKKSQIEYLRYIIKKGKFNSKTFMRAFKDHDIEFNVKAYNMDFDYQSQASQNLNNDQMECLNINSNNLNIHQNNSALKNPSNFNLQHQQINLQMKNEQQ